ncbi:MAG: hypothetical protein ABUK01_12420 [Leptospirales bacterium]
MNMETGYSPAFLQNRLISNIIKVVIYTLLYICLLLSLLPFVGWWGGTGAAVLYAFIYVAKKLSIFPAGNIHKVAMNRWLRLSMYTVFIGIIFYTGVRIYSNMKVNLLIAECSVEQAKSDISN